MLCYDLLMCCYRSLARQLGAGLLACGLLLVAVIFPVAGAQAGTGSGHARCATTTPPSKPVQVSEGTVTLMTYPLERYQTAVVDPQYKWPYQRFDFDRFRAEAPKPQPRTYRTLVLENEYLRLTILPELGGRLWRVVHKPTGNDLFYHNSVVMPSPWGPAGMRGWLAIGGLEWNLPVVEHGYAWGTPWDVTALRNDGQTAAVTLSTPRDGRTLGASVTIGLRVGEAAFSVDQAVTNLSDEPVRFAIGTAWHWHRARQTTQVPRRIL